MHRTNEVPGKDLPHAAMEKPKGVLCLGEANILALSIWARKASEFPVQGISDHPTLPS
jgi:hypothetical protein